MTLIDWTGVVLWVVGTSAFGVYFQRYIGNTRDYLLAGRRLRWWQIGLAQAADAVDACDFVAVTGQGFRTGLVQLGYAWWGMGIGSVLLSRYVAPLLYRTGVYTNAEYLELRFGRSLRLASAVLQVLYRFVAMALVVYAVATMFQVIIGFDLWLGVWLAMGLTLAYVFTSGQLGTVMAAIPADGPDAADFGLDLCFCGQRDWWLVRLLRSHRRAGATEPPERLPSGRRAGCRLSVGAHPDAGHVSDCQSDRGPTDPGGSF